MRRLGWLWVVSASLLLTLVACGGTLEVGVEMTPTPRHESSLGRLAYMQGGDVWVRDLRSFPDGEPRRLTTDGVNASPRWSPSGQWLAFRKGEYQVWLARADGSVARPVNEGAAVGPFAWAPGTDRLAYVAGDGELRAVDADGSGPATLVLQSPYGRVGRIAWSPDGTWIAYEWWEQQPEQVLSNQGLWKVSADGKERSALYASGVPEKGEAILAGWSSDGRILFFWQGEILSASMLADGVPLYALPAAGGTPVSLAECVLVHSDFVVPAPAGTAQVAIVTGGGRGTWTNKALFVTQAVGGGGVAVTPPEVAASSPAWSPDARQIAYVAVPDRGDLVGGESARQGLMERRLWVANVEGEPRARQLTDDSAYRDEYPLWSADGDHLLFARLNAEGQASLWLTPAEGGEPRQVVEELTPLPGPASGWFGYYGHVEWGQVFDWWTGSLICREVGHAGFS